MTSPWCLTVVGLLAACSFDFERMQVQRRVNEYADDPTRLALMAHAESTAAAVPHDRVVGQPERTQGCVGKSYTTQLPVAATDELLAVGRSRFTRFCAACHGATGNGASLVAQAMARTKPRSLLVPPVRDYAPGRIYRTLTFGYKLMPTYADDLGLNERWAVVAYLKSLQQEPRRPGDDGPAAQPSLGPTCPGGEP